MTELESTSLSMPGSSRICYLWTGFGGDKNPSPLMFTRWGPLSPYFGVSGQASVRRCKIVYLTLEKLMPLYIQQMSQVERPVLAFLPDSVVEAWCTYPQRAYLWKSTYCLAWRSTCRYRSRIYYDRTDTARAIVRCALPLTHERLIQLRKPDRRRSTMSSECVSISSIDLWPYVIVSMGGPLW